MTWRTMQYSPTNWYRAIKHDVQYALGAKDTTCLTRSSLTSCDVKFESSDPCFKFQWGGVRCSVFVVCVLAGPQCVF